MSDSIISRCGSAGQRLTDPRKVAAQVLHDDDHCCSGRLHARDIDLTSIPICRTVELCEEEATPHRLDLGDGRTHFNDAKRDHQRYLSNMNSGEVIGFIESRIEALQ